jgi:hypothetical protein
LRKPRWLRNTGPVTLRRFLVGGVLVSAALLAASPAAADVGVVKVSPNVAAPDSAIEITLGCGFPRCPTRLPVSLVPLSQAPKPHPCGANALCSPMAEGRPRSPPFVFLGWARERGSQPVVRQYHLRARVPGARPGAYAFVIYVGSGNPGAHGVLVADTTEPGKLLHVRAEQASVASNGAATDAGWWIAVAAVLIAVAAGGVFLRRRSSA